MLREFSLTTLIFAFVLTPTAADMRDRISKLFRSSDATISQEAHNEYELENYVKAIPLMMGLAEQGDARAQFDLGYAYDRGYGGLKKDYVSATNWMRKSAEQGYSSAQFQLGWYYALGVGNLAPDATKAAALYQAALATVRRGAAAGSAEAQYQLAVAYLNGWGVTPDGAESAKWLRLAAAQGHVSAQYVLSNVADITRREAVTWKQKAAEQGHSSARWQLGVAYLFGDGVPQDSGKGVWWLEKAAWQGNAGAIMSLGDIYYYGRGVRQDSREAAKWYLFGAQSRPCGPDSFSSLNLGKMYAAGDGVPMNYVQAYRWFNVASTDNIFVGYAEAAAGRDRVAANMTPGQIAEAQQLSSCRHN